MTQLANDARGAAIQVAAFGVSENVSYTGTAAQSSVFPVSVNVIRLVASTDCFVLFGTNPTATSSSAKLIAGVAEAVRVTPGQRLSVVQDFEAGSLNITYYT